MALIFKDAEKARDEITKTQQKEIANLYENWANEIGERAKFYSHHSTPSSYVSERQAKELQKMLKTTGQEVSKEIESKIKSNIYTIADAVVADNIKWLESFGFSSEGLNAAFSYVPDVVVRNLITGQIYDSGWSLSARIWGDNETTMKDIYQVMAKGLAENKSVYEIAKNLESYVRPSAKLPWNPVIAMKNTKTGKIEYKRIYKNQVDYNAQRLARTLAQHSYQQSFLATTQKNPFITEYIWHSNGSRPCPLCLDRDGVTFQKDALPMDHPNGMCTMEPVIAKDMVDQLADWFNSPDGTYPEIDTFASNFGYNAAKGGSVQDFINKYGTSTKNPSAWYHSMTPVQKAEAKLLKEASGLGWDEWYTKNIYTGSADDLAAWKAKVAAKKGAKATSKVDDVVKYSEDDVIKMLQTGSNYQEMSRLFGKYGYNIEDFFDDYENLKVNSPAFEQALKKVTGQNIETVKTNVVADRVDNAFDSTKWYESIRGNDVRAMNNWTNEWLGQISSAEREGVTKYTSNAYRDMNGFLRGHRSSTQYPNEIEACKSALSKASLPQEVIVRRGSDYNMLEEVGLRFLSPEEKNKAIGMIVQDKGFTSTSPASSGGFSDSIEYVIKVPKGSQAMYIDSISRFEGEQELLINCGGKFMVEDIGFNSYGEVNKIFMTLINLQ